MCANGAVIYDRHRPHPLSAGRCRPTQLGELAEIATRVIPGAGLAVERVGGMSHDAATPQFVSSPGYEHAWLNPDNTEVSLEDLLGAPAIKLLIRKAGARSGDMAAELAKHVGIEGDITFFHRERPCRDCPPRDQQGHRCRGGRAAPGDHRR